MLFPRALLTLLLLACALPVQAQVYKWVDSAGVVHYSDKPHRQNEQPATLPPLQTFTPGPTTDPFAGESANTAAASAVTTPTITSPAADATIRHAQNELTVVVSAKLQPGQGLVYFLDGKAQNETPTASTAYRMTHVYRGAHQLSVALMGGDGRALATSKPVTFYMKPPTAHHRHR